MCVTYGSRADRGWARCHKRASPASACSLSWTRDVCRRRYRPRSHFQRPTRYRRLRCRGLFCTCDKKQVNKKLSLTCDRKRVKGSAHGSSKILPPPTLPSSSANTQPSAPVFSSGPMKPQKSPNQTSWKSDQDARVPNLPSLSSPLTVDGMVAMESHMRRQGKKSSSQSSES